MKEVQLARTEVRAALCILLIATLPGLALAQEWNEKLEVRFVSPATSQKQASKAVRLSLVDRDWKLEKESETTIYATYDSNGAWARVIVTFDTSKASVALVDGSSNTPTPDMRSRAWAANLAKDIRINLQRLQILSE
jgi:hypothetical protein